MYIRPGRPGEIEPPGHHAFCAAETGFATLLNRPGSAIQRKTRPGGNHDAYDTVFYSGVEFAYRGGDGGATQRARCLDPGKQRRAASLQLADLGAGSEPRPTALSANEGSIAGSAAVKNAGMPSSCIGAVEVRPGHSKTLARMRPRGSRFHHRADLERL
jgi:hypothetical protein